MQKGAESARPRRYYSFTMTFMLATTPLWSFSSKEKVPNALISLSRGNFLLIHVQLILLLQSLGHFLGGNGPEQPAACSGPCRDRDGFPVQSGLIGLCRVQLHLSVMGLGRVLGLFGVDRSEGVASIACPFFSRQFRA